MNLKREIKIQIAFLNKYLLRCSPVDSKHRVLIYTPETKYDMYKGFGKAV